MKATEAAALLTIAAAYDNRRPDADQAKAWAMALDDLRFEDCRTVIVEHYRKSRDWLMPVDVIQGVKRLRSDRLLEFGPVPEPQGIDPDDTERYTAAYMALQRSIADGELTREQYDREAPVAVGPARDAIRELGHIGQTVDDALKDKPARQAHADAIRAKQGVEAEKKRAEDARRADLERMRREDEAARAALRGAASEEESNA
jgi:hypothetical protein